MVYKTKNWNLLEIKDITDYISDMRRESIYGGRYYNIVTKAQADEVKAFLNDPRNTSSKSMKDFKTGVPFWNEQKVDYLVSNLNRGFQWYFICNNCDKRVRFLYEYSGIESPLCRVCLGIGYERRPTRRRNPGEYPTIMRRTWPNITEIRKWQEMAKIVEL